eukprot:3205634-Prymnesium_polylepis.1
MSRAWVPSVSVALVRSHASMPDDERLSDRVFCVCDLVYSKLAGAAYLRSTAFSCINRTTLPYGVGAEPEDLASWCWFVHRGRTRYDDTVE